MLNLFIFIKAFLLKHNSLILFQGNTKLVKRSYHTRTVLREECYTACSICRLRWRHTLSEYNACTEFCAKGDYNDVSKICPEYVTQNLFTEHYVG